MCQGETFVISAVADPNLANETQCDVDMVYDSNCGCSWSLVDRKDLQKMVQNVCLPVLLGAFHMKESTGKQKNLFNFAYAFEERFLILYPPRKVNESILKGGYGKRISSSCNYPLSAGTFESMIFRLSKQVGDMFPRSLEGMLVFRGVSQSIFLRISTVKEVEPWLRIIGIVQGW